MVHRKSLRFVDGSLLFKKIIILCFEMPNDSLTIKSFNWEKNKYHRHSPL